MHFRIADTFTDSLARLTGEEQKLVKTTAFDLQLNPASPGMQFHKLDKAKDKRFWSVRVGGDLRLIVHREEDSLLLCYVGRHDPAYHWAERRRLETHPRTGAAQFVEVRELVEEIVIPSSRKAEETAVSRTPLFVGVADEALLGYGVPAEWLDDVQKANEDALLALVEHLPAEAGEALLQLATGGTPYATQDPATAELLKVAEPAGKYFTNPFDHPDAQRRFRVINNVEELERALAYPWEKWTIFLHPEQRHWVEREYSGPTRVSESAGTGKTIVALHRAVFLARVNPDARVLLTTFSEALANALHTRIRRLIHNEPRLADRLLGPELSDVDGNAEKREGTVSVFNGQPPTIQVLGGVEDEIHTVGAWLRNLGKEGVMPHEMGVFVRSAAEMERACTRARDRLLVTGVEPASEFLDDLRM